MENQHIELKNDGALALNVISKSFGILALAIGIINTFWGQPVGFGIFIMLLSFAYFLPVNILVKSLLGFTIPRLGLLKVLLALFILWASLGVGELFNKIENMLHYFNN